MMIGPPGASAVLLQHARNPINPLASQAVTQPPCAFEV